MPAPVLLFDFDGVVADSFAVFYQEFSAVLRELGYEHLASQEAILNLFDSNIIAGLLKAGFPFYRLKKLADKIGPRIAGVTREIVPFGGMPELLTKLAARHPVYVVTSNVTDATELFLGLHAVEGVRAVLGSDKESSKVKKIRQVRALHPEGILYYIGDTKGDMLEATEAGVVPVAVTWGWHEEARLLEARPQHVVRSVEDLEKLFGAGGDG